MSKICNLYDQMTSRNLKKKYLNMYLNLLSRVDESTVLQTRSNDSWKNKYKRMSIILVLSVMLVKQLPERNFKV